jgi:hypothetical protein
VLRRAVWAAFDQCTQQQLKMLQRRPDLGMGLVEAAFALRTGHVDGDVTRNFELLGHRVRSCLALEAKLNEDARSRHAREAHGAPQPRERERGERPLPPVTAEDQESVIGPEPVVREAGEKFLRRYGSGCWIGLSRITPGRGGGERLSRRRFRGGCERFPGACAEAQG